MALTTSIKAADAQDVEKLKSEVHDKGWLVVGSETETEDWDLFVMRPDGSDRRRITKTPEYNEASPRFSPDGKRLFYYRMPKSHPVANGDSCTHDLIFANVDGTDQIEFGKGYNWATWSPDGKQIACVRSNAVLIVDVATKEIVNQFPRKGVIARQLGWSPDGKKLVANCNNLGAMWNIGCVDLETKQVTPVSETIRYNCTPDWVPDGKRIVYARGIMPDGPGRAELWVANLDGTERTRLYADPDHHIYGACSSPDGNYLIFTRSVQDLGKAHGTVVALIRWPKTPQPENTTSATRLDLGSGFEPHWTAKDIFKK